MAKLIKKELDKDEAEPASKLQKTSPASEAEFWMTASKNLHKLVGDTFRSAEQLLAQQAAASFRGRSLAERLHRRRRSNSFRRRTFRQNRWELAQLTVWRRKRSTSLKFELAQQLGSFKPQLASPAWPKQLAHSTAAAASAALKKQLAHRTAAAVSALR